MTAGADNPTRRPSSAIPDAAIRLQLAEDAQVDIV